MGKIIYTIGEAADEIGESTSLVRFWTTKFDKFLSPRRNAKGNRLYSPEDLETLRQIHFLVKESGMTLEGAARTLASDKKSVGAKVRVLESLREIRARLLEIRSEL